MYELVVNTVVVLVVFAVAAGGILFVVSAVVVAVAIVDASRVWGAAITEDPDGGPLRACWPWLT